MKCHEGEGFGKEGGGGERKKEGKKGRAKGPEIMAGFYTELAKPGFQEKSGFRFWFQFWPRRRGWGIFASLDADHLR